MAGKVLSPVYSSVYHIFCIAHTSGTWIHPTPGMCCHNFLLQGREEPRRRGARLDLFPSKRRGWWDVWSSRAAWTMEWWSWGPLGQWGGCRASTLPWDSGEQISVSSGIFLGQSHGIMPRREEGPKKAGWYSRIASSNLYFHCFVPQAIINKSDTRPKLHILED